jgi:hypothetical protein
VDISLSTYGWTGSWANQQGFDSLMQMSAGIAHAGMAQSLERRPVPLPVQALGHATGYILAAAAIRGLVELLKPRRGTEARASLARTALLLAAHRRPSSVFQLDGPGPNEFQDVAEATAWGPARRLRLPFEIEGLQFRWDRPAGPLGTARPCWTTQESPCLELQA